MNNARRSRDNAENHASKNGWSSQLSVGIAHTMALRRCSICIGTGARRDWRSGEHAPCECVLRNIFRACLRKYRSSLEEQLWNVARVHIEADGSRKTRPGASTWTRPTEEYVADFLLCCYRVLSTSEMDAEIFNLHFIFRYNWRACTLKLSIDRGTFFHSVYRIENKLGKYLCEVRPYALFPIDEYFSRVSVRILS